MDRHKYSTQVERLEVVETGRRRRWSDDEKLRIVIESLQTPRAISSTARRHGISRSLLMTWQRSFRPEPTPPVSGRLRASDRYCWSRTGGCRGAGKRADGDYRWQRSSGDRRCWCRCDRPGAGTAGSGAPMIPVAVNVHIWIATGHTDMRKGMLGLALLVQEGLGRDPFCLLYTSDAADE